MKKLIFVAICSLCGFGNHVCYARTPEDNVVKLEWHALTSSKVNETNELISGLGHSYVVINNVSRYSQKIGYYNIPSGKQLSIGLWQSSDSIFSSSTSSSSDHNGVFYDYDRALFTNIETPQNDVYVSALLDNSKIISVSKLIRQKNDSYDVISYNCATFSTDIWNTATGSSFDTGNFRKPSAVREDIMNSYESSYYTNLNLTFTASYFYYSGSTQCSFVI